MHPKLAWTNSLASSLGLAMNCSVVATFQNDVDPLKKYVHLTFGDGLLKGDYRPIQTMVHAFAKENDCVVYKIYRPKPSLMILEIFIKTRISDVMSKNPLSGDKS